MESLVASIPIFSTIMGSFIACLKIGTNAARAYKTYLGCVRNRTLAFGELVHGLEGRRTEHRGDELHDRIQEVKIVYRQGACLRKSLIQAAKKAGDDISVLDEWLGTDMEITDLTMAKICLLQGYRRGIMMAGGCEVLSRGLDCVMRLLYIQNMALETLLPEGPLDDSYSSTSCSGAEG